MPDKLRLNEEEWRRRLSSEEYRVLRGHGTEPAGSGCLLKAKELGTYVCAACGNPLFKSGEKFESGTGWPSFTQPVSPDAVTEHEDRSYGMIRSEVRCARCDSHLGHVFSDGPPRTGLRYCMNSVAMKHVPEGEPIPLVTGQSRPLSGTGGLAAAKGKRSKAMANGEKEVITLGGGCFWCVEAVFEQLRGVEQVIPGYAGGHVPNPTYRQVRGKNTGHAEPARRGCRSAVPLDHSLPQR
jgi:peptide-methionine (R)-S-oxide reductase